VIIRVTNNKTMSFNMNGSSFYGKGNQSKSPLEKEKKPGDIGFIGPLKPKDSSELANKKASATLEEHSEFAKNRTEPTNKVPNQLKNKILDTAWEKEFDKDPSNKKKLDEHVKKMKKEGFTTRTDRD